MGKASHKQIVKMMEGMGYEVYESVPSEGKTVMLRNEGNGLESVTVTGSSWRYKRGEGND